MRRKLAIQEKIELWVLLGPMLMLAAFSLHAPVRALVVTAALGCAWRWRLWGCAGGAVLLALGGLDLASAALAASLLVFTLSLGEAGSYVAALQAELSRAQQWQERAEADRNERDAYRRLVRTQQEELEMLRAHQEKLVEENLELGQKFADLQLTAPKKSKKYDDVPV
jgi:hypothetical protein